MNYILIDYFYIDFEKKVCSNFENDLFDQQRIFSQKSQIYQNRKYYLKK